MFYKKANAARGLITVLASRIPVCATRKNSITNYHTILQDKNALAGWETDTIHCQSSIQPGLILISYSYFAFLFCILNHQKPSIPDTHTCGLSCLTACLLYFLGHFDLFHLIESYIRKLDCKIIYICTFIIFII